MDLKDVHEYGLGRGLMGGARVLTGRGLSACPLAVILT